MNLIDLLQSREIVHPSRVSAVALTHGELRLTISGYPWWRVIDGWNGEEEDIVLVFSGMTEGVLDVECVLDFQDDEALEEFEVDPLMNHGWARPPVFDITCYAPMPDPLTLYARVEDYLSEVGALKTARNFLNTGGGIEQFRLMTANESYNVAKVPEVLRAIVCDQLEAQNVRYNVLTAPSRTRDLLLVRLCGSTFTCETASALFLHSVAAEN